MNNKVKKKNNKIVVFSFILGLLLYLVGLILVISPNSLKTLILKVFSTNITSGIIAKLKIFGIMLFLIGFIFFIIAIIFLYKDDKNQENNVNLIIEGKADVITIIVMTYIMIFMLVICLLFDEYLGALLFGLSIIIQTIVNSLLIQLYSKSYRRR